MWEISTDNGLTWTSTNVPATGEKGDQGEKGDDGEDGEEGNGITGITVNEDNYLVISMLRGNPIIIEKSIVGEKGERGEQGEQGVGIKSVRLTDDYMLVITLTNNTTLEPIGPIRGAQGPVGPEGATGATGPQGERGPEGATGATGPQGERGPEGATGATGPQGERGPEGATGATGPQGERGPEGATGATGPQGEQGPQGIQGEQGPQGEKGDAGNDGLTPYISIDADGNLYVKYGENGTLTFLACIKGPKGDKGDPGEQGPEGATGPQGEKGPEGATGATGPQGERGPEGATGATGPQGEPGRGILRTEISGTNWIIYYTDGTTETHDMSGLVNEDEASYLIYKELEDGTYSVAVNTTYSTFITSVNIPATYNDKPVTVIADEAFKDCTRLTRVTIPDSVTTIGENVFQGCGSLESMTIPFVGSNRNSTETFGYLFGTSSYTGGVKTEQYNVSGSKTYYVPGSLKTVTVTGGEIPFGAFSCCKNLTSITIPYSVSSISAYAFYGCLGLTNIIIPDNVTTIDDYAFAYCRGVTSVIIPAKVSNVGSKAFYFCSGMISVTIEEGVTTIGEIMFGNCDALISIAIPDSVTTIGGNAFVNCGNLINATIGSGVTTVGANVFRNCTSLKSVTIGDGVTTINGGMFAQCANLTSVTIPDSVTTIGVTAFISCKNLTSITIPTSVTTISSRAFRNASLRDVYYLGTEEEKAGMSIDETGNDALINATWHYRYVNEGTEGLEYYPLSDGTYGVTVGTAMYLEEIVIPEKYNGKNVTAIMYNAFDKAVNLKKITIPSTITTIYNDAFLDCTTLESVHIESIESWLNIRFKNAYANPLNKGASLYIDGEIITDLVIPEGISEIKFAAFYGSNIASVELPETLTTINKSAFAHCANLTEVTIPNSCTYIGSYAFYNASLTKMTLPYEGKKWTLTNLYYDWADKTKTSGYNYENIIYFYEVNNKRNLAALDLDVKYNVATAFSKQQYELKPVGSDVGWPDYVYLAEAVWTCTE